MELDIDREIVRYARPMDVPNGILSSTAFDRPEKDRDGLSVCVLGIFHEEFVADLNEIRRVLGAWRELKANGRLAQISVASVLAVAAEVDRALSVVEDPVDAIDGKPPNPAHALIVGLPFAGAENGTLNSVLASDLLARRVSALHPATL